MVENGGRPGGYVVDLPLLRESFNDPLGGGRWAGSGRRSQALSRILYEFDWTNQD